MSIEARKQLSASQIQCLFRCPREYAYQYILKIPQPRNGAMLFGSAFHAAVAGETVDYEGLRVFDNDYPWAKALDVMISGHDFATAEVGARIAGEARVETDDTILIVDDVVEKDGRWWLVERKTSGRLDESKRSWVPRDVQMVIYAGSVSEIANELFLNSADFGGVQYITTMKPSERRKKTETADEYGARMTSQTHVWTYPADIFETAVAQKQTLFSYAKMLQADIHRTYEQFMRVETLPANTACCTRYNSPCPFRGMCDVASGAPPLEEKCEEA